MEFLNTLLQNEYINIVFRALSVYVFMIVALRIFGKKELAQLSVVDLVFILLISNAVQNAMVGPSTSLEGGLVAASALFSANYTLKKVMYRNKKLSQILQGEAVPLIYKGSVNEANCRKAEISITELQAAVREHGVNAIDEVDIAMLEVDGNISIVSTDYQKRSTNPLPKQHKLKGRLSKK
ncbi:MAG: DUF421 domain-containing protein [Phycisphaerales bacterium]|nr:DUF421 domain-containing protein [Phycisphaerales bacterium]